MFIFYMGRMRDLQSGNSATRKISRKDGFSAQFPISVTSYEKIGKNMRGECDGFSLRFCSLCDILFLHRQESFLKAPQALFLLFAKHFRYFAVK